MKFSTTALLGAAAPLAAAFPAAMIDAMKSEPELVARAATIMEKRQAGADAATAIFEPVNTFDASKQLIDLTDYPWQAPGEGDLRGPCPGLNAFANHGFLPRNGYATIDQYVKITESVVGMGPVLALFLAALGASIDGDLLAWSMGGTPGPGVGGPLAHFGNGLIGSHNKYESDASPTRPDLYDPSSDANDYKTVASQFQQLINYSPGGYVTLDSLTSFRSYRFDKQVASNPYFFNGPFTGVLVQPAAYTFIYRFMANHSEAAPAGELSYDVIKSWFAIEGDSGSYTAQQGYERIPENWYRRAFEYPYEVDYFLADVLNAAALHPKFLDVGGNTGKTNTFTGVNITDLTGGVFNGATLAQGNNLGCFAFQAATQANVDLVSTLVKPVTSALSSLLGPLSCPQLQAIDNEQLSRFPGYVKSQSS